MSTTRLGTFRFYQQAGQPFADLVNNALKPAIGSVAVSKYLGASVLWALAFGVITVAALLTVAVVMGWLVVRFHVYQDAIRADWKVNPAMSEQLRLLDAIERNTRWNTMRVFKHGMVVQ